jgi:hypothetical protein
MEDREEGEIGEEGEAEEMQAVGTSLGSMEVDEGREDLASPLGGQGEPGVPAVSGPPQVVLPGDLVTSQVSHSARVKLGKAPLMYDVVKLSISCNAPLRQWACTTRRRGNRLQGGLPTVPAAKYALGGQLSETGTRSMQFCAPEVNL